MFTNFLRVPDASAAEFLDIIELALQFKRKEFSSKILSGRNIGLYFEKNSTRTRISFEVAVNQLGGSPLILTMQDMQLARGESIYDTAKVLERYLDAFVARVFSHSTLVEMAETATIPIVNSLSDLEHPCQILADFATILEHKGDVRNKKIVYVGDGNNVANSLLFASALMGSHFTFASPEAFTLNPQLIEEARILAEKSGGTIRVSHDPREAVQDADVLYTDTWMSMGDSDEKRQQVSAFLPFQINATLLSEAKKDCIVMHCLPAHRNDEITDEVMDGPQSVIWDQAEHRLHAQKALLVRIFEQRK